MKWSEFTAAVRVNLTIHADQFGIQDFIDSQIRASVRDIQNHIKAYQVGHVSSFTVFNTFQDGESTVGALPYSGRISHAFRVKTGYTCERTPLRKYSWDKRNDLVCGNAGCWNRIAVAKDGKQFMVYPGLSPDGRIEIHWDGIKAFFGANDETPFDDEMVDVVSEWVTAKIVRRTHSDIQLHNSHMLSYGRARNMLAVSKREQGEIKKEVPVARSSQKAWVHSGAEVKEGELKSDIVAVGYSGGDSSNAKAVTERLQSVGSHVLQFLGQNNLPDGAFATLFSNLMVPFGNFIPKHARPAWGPAELSTQADSLWGKPLETVFADQDFMQEDKLYYDYAVGGIRVFVLNSGFSAGEPREPDGITDDSDQAQWLEARLDETDEDWKVVVCPRAPYTSTLGSTGGAAELRWPFGDWGANLVLSGSPANYERLLVDGVAYVVAGIGGAASLESFEQSPVAGSQVRDNVNFGFVRLVATEAGLQLVAYSKQKGTLIDNVLFSK